MPLAMVKFVGHSASPILTLVENAELLLRELGDALGAGPNASVSVRESDDPISVFGSVAGKGVVATVYFAPADHFFVIDVVAAREIDRVAVDRKIRARLGRCSCHVVDFNPPVHPPRS